MTANRGARSLLPLGLLLPLLAGCADGYSADLRYPLRSDPILKPLTAETRQPDRPGDLPLMSLAGLNRLTYLNMTSEFLDQYRASVLSPANLSGQDQADIRNALEEMFGTPMTPHVAGPDSKTVSLLEQRLKMDKETLAQGSRLYRQHCLHCHGLTGDGRGPTGFWINPHPRDYRKGIFKFVSTGDPARTGRIQKPAKADLIHVVRQGLDNTAMPAFSFLRDAEIDAIASYVIHLSLRGQIEAEIMELILSDSRPDETSQYIQDGLGVYGKTWLESQERVVLPDPYPYKEDGDDPDGEFAQSVRRGRDIYSLPGKDGGSAPCFQCHADFGRKSTFRFDTWGTMIRPADLTRGAFRGGRRSVDLYWRIYNGVPGTDMPSSANLFAWSKQELDAWNKNEKNKPTTHKLWDLVNYIRVLPYPEMRKFYKVDIY